MGGKTETKKCMQAEGTTYVSSLGCIVGLRDVTIRFHDRWFRHGIQYFLICVHRE